ncbi:hypothetical protein F5I97DRAFT_82811 [Phlebopus sp. FC_14]|nr:hypothetical protein F5I97DRAFT_82811 [Phlebopus sp. FC_14]
MSIPRNIPRILIERATPSELTAAETLDIKEVLDEAGGLPNLLSRNSVTDFAASLTCDDDFFSRDVPAFPDGHQPPLFIVHSHRAQLPFPLRPDVQELGDFCSDEDDFRPILTVPTMPRMKLIIKERIFVHKWVYLLTTDDPPQHVPWASDRPVQEKKWVSEGSIFPAEMIQSLMHRRRKDHACVPASCLTRPTPCGNEACNPEDLHTFREASVHPSGSRRDKRWSIQMSVNTLKYRAPSTGCLPVPPTTKSSVPQIHRSTPSPGRLGCSISKLPLAARRGKLMTSLQMKGSLVEELEYPDFPTAFRGSSSAHPPGFGYRGPIRPFTDHQEMLSGLRAKCHALANVLSTPEREKEISGTATSLVPDESEFSQELASLERKSTSPVGGCSRLSSILRLCLDDENGKNTPDFSGFDPKLRSAPVHAVTVVSPGGVGPQLLMPSTCFTSSSGPPGVPLPARPALINPATPSHVRGILKKAKSVRFEDLTSSDVWGDGSTNGPPVSEQPPILKRPTPLRQSLTAIPDRLSPNKVETAMHPAAKMEGAVPKAASPQGPAEATKRAPRPRLAPKDIGLKSKRLSVPDFHKESNSQRNCPSPKSRASATVERPCRMTSIMPEESPSPIADLQTQRNQRSSVGNVSNLQRGLEGLPKSRLSTPLRNIFRFK